MSTETLRDADGQRLCEHCQTKPVPESLGTKPRRYCSRNCRQRAYEARKTREAIVTSVAVAVARDRTSRDVPADDRATSRDVAKPQATPTEPSPDPRQKWVWSGMQMLPMPLDDPAGPESG